MQYILTDIEGTTTSVRYVYDVLFPYFVEQVTDFASTYRDDPALAANMTSIQQTVNEEEHRWLTEEETVQQMIAWTKSDRKHTALKNIQGMVWKKGYEQQLLKSHVYDDVPPAFANWQQQGISVGIYSSGSVLAQQLLFRHSLQGDLSPFIRHYFDTGIGHKRDTSSYLHIQQQINIPAPEILFLSDTEAELDAAAAAGFATRQITRNGSVPGVLHPIATDFSAIIQ